MVGPGLFKTKRTIEEEVEYSKTSWIDREAIDSSTGIRSRKA